MIKRLFMPLVALAFFGGVAVADADALRSLNETVAKLLAPYQNPTTSAGLIFNKIETDAKHALAVDVSGLFTKDGSQNRLRIQLDQLAYDYSSGVAPRVSLRGSVGLDLTKFYARADLNAMVDDLQNTVDGLKDNFAAEYGDAVTVLAQITQKTKDADGNYEHVEGQISFDLDVAKLPVDKKAEDVIATAGRLQFSVDATAGFTLSADVGINPRYRGFADDQAGLKDLLDKLLTQDSDTMDQLSQYIEMIDGYAADIVEYVP